MLPYRLCDRSSFRSGWYEASSPFLSWSSRREKEPKRDSAAQGLPTPQASIGYVEGSSPLAVRGAESLYRALHKKHDVRDLDRPTATHNPYVQLVDVIAGDVTMSLVYGRKVVPIHIDGPQLLPVQ